MGLQHVSGELSGRFTRREDRVICAGMKVDLPLAEMSVGEKLEVIETVWADLVRAEARVESPAWHDDVLMVRAKEVAAGVTPLGWDEAKRRLLEL